MASRITTYNTLVSAIQEAAEDVGTELLEFLPVAIDNAENRLARELDTLDLVYTSTITVTASTDTFTKPAGHKVTYHVEYKDPTTGRSKVLRKKTDDYIAEYWQQPTSVGTPKYYSDEDTTTFRIAPCCSAAASVKIRGIRRPTVLSSSNQSNVFTSSTPDALFHATMIEVAGWQRNSDLLNYHTQQYISIRDNVNNEGRRQRRDDGTRPTAETAPNTLKGDA